MDDELVQVVTNDFDGTFADFWVWNDIQVLRDRLCHDLLDLADRDPKHRSRLGLLPMCQDPGLIVVVSDIPLLHMDGCHSIAGIVMDETRERGPGSLVATSLDAGVRFADLLNGVKQFGRDDWFVAQSRTDDWQRLNTC